MTAAEQWTPAAQELAGTVSHRQAPGRRSKLTEPLGPSTRRSIIDDLCDEAAALAAAAATYDLDRRDPWARMVLAYDDGLAGTTYDGPGGTGATKSPRLPIHLDRTGNPTQDRARADHLEADRQLIDALRHTRRVTMIVDAYRLRDTDATAGEQRESLIAEAAKDPGCENCARCVRNGAKTYSVTKPRRKGTHTDLDDLDGQLPRPMRICRWCADVHERIGRLPKPSEIALHEDGKRPFGKHADPKATL